MLMVASNYWNSHIDGVFDYRRCMNPMRVIAICHNVPKRTEDNKGDSNPRGISQWTQNSGSLLPISFPPFPYFNGFLYGSSMRMGVPLLGVPGTSQNQDRNTWILQITKELPGLFSHDVTLWLQWRAQGTVTERQTRVHVSISTKQHLKHVCFTNYTVICR